MAQIVIDHIRYRRVNKDKEVCRKWLDDVINGRIKKRLKKRIPQVMSDTVVIS